MTLIYHLLLAAVDVFAVVFLARKPSLVRWFAVMFVFALAAIGMALLAVGYGRRPVDSFYMVRLVSHAVFFHGTLLLAASALVLWGVRRRVAMALGLLAGSLGLVAFDAWIIEPTWLEVSRVRIVSPKIARPMRIVVLADVQTDRFGDYERQAIELAMAEKPDVVLWAGDYIQAPAAEKAALREQFRAFLLELGYRAPLGEFAVQGNVDGGDWAAMFADTEVKVVRQSESFDLDGVRLTCLSISDAFNPRLELATAEPAGAGPAPFCIVLGHSPDFALGAVEADLLLAGHTHGGQIQVPLLGPLITNCHVPRRWASGQTERPQGGTLIVSRGIGLERGSAPRIRFFCRPELLVIDLEPQTTPDATNAGSRAVGHADAVEPVLNAPPKP
jgi:hypothetical protein